MNTFEQMAGEYAERIDALVLADKEAEARHIMTGSGWMPSEARTYLRARALSLGVVL